MSPLTSKPLYLPVLPITSWVLEADLGFVSLPLWVFLNVSLILPAHHAIHLCSSRGGWGAGDREPQKTQSQQG